MSHSQRKFTIVQIVSVLILLLTGCSGLEPKTAETRSIPTGTPLPTAALPPQATPTDPVPAGGEFACIPDHERQFGKVTHVVDGDTIQVEMDGREYTVRYIGMDSPETVKPNTPVEYYGPEASARNKQLVGGKSVVLVKDVSETDAYDRLLRYVVADGVFVNYELVAQGYAQGKSYPPDVSCNDTFEAIERKARENSIGMWATATPVPSPTQLATDTPSATETVAIAPTATQPANCDPGLPDGLYPPAAARPGLQRHPLSQVQNPAPGPALV